MKPLLKTVFIVAVLGIAGWLAIKGVQNSFRQGAAGGRIWFYDESEKKLYSMPDTTIPPDKGIGGPSDDGEQAIVVSFGKDVHDRSQWRIAYLKKYTPGLKQTLDEMIIARAAHRIFDGSAVSRQNEYFQTNTLVKRVNDTDWHTANSDEGKNIQKEWRSWRGADGSGPAVCAAE